MVPHSPNLDFNKILITKAHLQPREKRKNGLYQKYKLLCMEGRNLDNEKTITAWHKIFTNPDKWF
jgi:hypothetical protein